MGISVHRLPTDTINHIRRNLELMKNMKDGLEGIWIFQNTQYLHTIGMDGAGEHFSVGGNPFQLGNTNVILSFTRIVLDLS